MIRPCLLDCHAQPNGDGRLVAGPSKKAKVTVSGGSRLYTPSPDCVLLHALPEAQMPRLLDLSAGEGDER